MAITVEHDMESVHSEQILLRDCYNIGMPVIDASQAPPQLSRLVAVVTALSQLGPPVTTILNYVQAWHRRLTQSGMYEVTDYEAKLELADATGKLATVKKRQQVRYLQDNIIAYQDQAWGDGQIALNYQTSVGTAVDRYRLDETTIILISLRGTRRRGDEDEFRIMWNAKNGYTKTIEPFGIEISHPTQVLTLRVIFPKDRPPQSAEIIEVRRRRTGRLDIGRRKRLADGRWQLSWQTRQPRLFERYLLQWEW